MIFYTLSSRYSHLRSGIHGFCHGCKHHIWILQGVQELLKQEIFHTIHYDNTAAICFSINPKTNNQSQYIDLAFHCTCQKVEEGTFTLVSVASKGNYMSICTKSLLWPTQNHFCHEIDFAKSERGLLFGDSVSSKSLSCGYYSVSIKDCIL